MEPEREAQQEQQFTGSRMQWGPKPQRPVTSADAEAQAALARARAVTSTEEALEVYAEWAERYDRDVFGGIKIVGPAGVVRRLGQRVAADAEMLDVGCGTGAVGSHLAASGCRNVDGIDVSPEMLAVAEGKGVYRRLITADVNEPLAIADAAYDAVISAGTFVSGHVGAAALRELVRITKPGGWLVVNVATAFWDEGDFESVIGELTSSGEIDVVVDESEPITVDETQHARVLELRRR